MRTRVIGGVLAGLVAVAVAFGAGGATPDEYGWAAGQAPADIHW